MTMKTWFLKQSSSCFENISVSEEKNVLKFKTPYKIKLGKMTLRKMHACRTLQRFQKKMRAYNFFVLFIYFHKSLLCFPHFPKWWEIPTEMLDTETRTLETYSTLYYLINYEYKGRAQRRDRGIPVLPMYVAVWHINQLWQLLRQISKWCLPERNHFKIKISN